MQPQNYDTVWKLSWGKKAGKERPLRFSARPQSSIKTVVLNFRSCTWTFCHLNYVIKDHVAFEIFHLKKVLDGSESWQQRNSSILS